MPSTAVAQRGVLRRASPQVRLLYAFPLLACVLPGTARAVRIDYEVGAAVLHSNNIRLAENGAESETVVSPQVRFDIEQTGSSFELSAKGEAQYLTFVEGVYDNQLRGALSGKAKWTIKPERLTFVVQDTLSSEPVSVLNGFTPGNQQQTNVFTAGPSFHARFGETTRGQLDLRYINSYAEENKDFGSNRYNVAARLLHDMDAVSSVSGNVEATRVDYDDPANDYRRYDGYVGYATSLTNLDVTLDAGYSRLEHRNAGTDSAPLTRAAVDWRLHPKHVLSVSVAFQISDATQDITSRNNRLEGPLIGDLTAAEVSIGPVVYKQSRVDAAYRFSGERLSFRVSPYYERVRYLEREDQTGRQLYRGGMASLSYRLRPTLSLEMVAAQTRRRFDDLDRTDRDSIVQASLLQQINRHWNWRLDGQHRQRDSSAFNQSYAENAVVFSIAYRR